MENNIIHNEFVVEDDSHDRRYFALIPILIDDLELSPYAVRLYLRIKRRAGENGKCFESSRNLAASCRMALGKVSAAKKELAQAGLIAIQTIPGKEGEFAHHEIRITDIWKANVDKYATCSLGEQEKLACSPHEQDRSHGEQGCSPCEHKDILTKKNPIKKIPSSENPEVLPLSGSTSPTLITGSEIFDKTQAKKLTEEQKSYLTKTLDIFAPKMFTLLTPIKNLLELRAKYPEAIIFEALEWAAYKKGMTPDKAVRAITTALPNWGSTKAMIKTGIDNGRKPVEAARPDPQKVNALAGELLRRRAEQMQGVKNG